MNAVSWTWKSALAWAVLVIATMIAGVIVPIKAPSVPHQLAWWLLANFLTVGALGVAALRAEWRGLRLGLVLAAIPVVIGWASAIEGSVFLGNTGISWIRLSLMTLISYGLAAPAWGVIFSIGRGTPVANYHPFGSQTIGEKVWKYAVSAFSYLFLYYLAGTIIFPFVRTFYATQTLPPAKTIIMLQLLLRGPLFVAICLLLLRMVGMTRGKGALVVGLIFTIVSGVTPLLVPNPYFPDAVRWVHFCEVTSSNFVFGGFVGWLWGERKTASISVMGQAA